MDSLNSNTGMGPQMYALKHATNSEAQNVLKVLESMDVLKRVDTPQAAVPIQEAASTGAELTGLGQKLDIRA